MKKIEKYSAANEELLAKNRYKNMEGRLLLTIQRLEESKDFRQVFQKLKQLSYPDWAIYMAIFGVVNSYRANYQKLSFEEMRNNYKKLLDGVEDESEPPVPIDEFSIEKMEKIIELNMLSSLKGYGYEIRRRQPNIKKVRKFLIEKYNYFGHDVPHEHWFKFESSYK